MSVNVPESPIISMCTEVAKYYDQFVTKHPGPFNTATIKKALDFLGEVCVESHEEIRKKILTRDGPEGTKELSKIGASLEVFSERGSMATRNYVQVEIANLLSALLKMVSNEWRKMIENHALTMKAFEDISREVDKQIGEKEGEEKFSKESKKILSNPRKIGIGLLTGLNIQGRRS